MSLHHLDFKIGHKKRRSFQEEEEMSFKCYVWGWIAGAAVSIGTGLIQKNQTKQAAKGAINAQKELVDSLKYEPIDIAGLTERAHEQAVSNATQSLALERQLQPALAQTRQGLQESVASQLALGGKLPPDVVNQVTQAARVGSGTSGTLGGSSIPLTAQMLGVSALNLLNQRQQNASNLLAANPLPEAGLDPGSIASLEAQQNAQQNQFNLEKAGVQSNLINSIGNANMANAGANNQIIGQVGSLFSSALSGSGGGGSSFGSGGSSLGSGLLSNLFNPSSNPQAASSGYSFQR